MQQPLVRAKTFADAVKTNLPIMGTSSRIVSVVTPTHGTSDTDKDGERETSDDWMRSGEREESCDLMCSHPPWHLLPYNFLVSVCRYLHDRERYQMACVCRRWREATQNPSLWRSHVFYLYCRHEVPQGLVWLSGRAQYLKHATIMCFGNFDRHREDFLRALQPANLLDLDINGAAYWWSAASGSATCSRVVARIVRLVKTQRQLRGFQMRQAMLPFTTGMGVLSALLTASGGTLQRLGLEDFFGEQAAFSVPTMPQRFTQVISQFSNLTELTINYEYLTDGLLRWVGNEGEERAIQLNVVSWLTSTHRPGVSKEAWAQLAASSRDVKVYLILQNIRSINEVRFCILRPEIPMHRLDLVGIAALGEDDNEDMADLLRHIASSYGHSLAGIRLWSDNFMCPEIEAGVLDLLRRSPKLVYLDLHMEVRCQMISTLCEMQKSHVINLQTLRLARSLTNFLEFEQFRAQVRTCFPILKNLGLDFHVRAESAPDHSARNEYVFIIADNAGIMDSEDEHYLASCSAASAASLPARSAQSPSRDKQQTAAAAAGDRNNSSTAAPVTLAGIQYHHHRRRPRRRRLQHARDSAVASAPGSLRFQFNWRQYRLRRQLRSRSRRYLGLN